MIHVAFHLHLTIGSRGVFSPEEFRELVSGRRRGFGAATARAMLRAAEWPCRWVVGWRNRRYDRGKALVEHVGVPVISVGNLTLGGTGKTPLVKWLAHWFGQRGTRVAIVSRGYGAAAGAMNDEAQELADALPDVPHVQNPDRVAAARRAVDKFGCQLVLLDDGFQHRRLARDLDLVLLDALEPFGFEHVFPRGTLREPVESLRRAEVVCLSRADLLTPDRRKLIERRVAEVAPEALWCEVAHVPTMLRSATGQCQPLETLAGRRVAAFCGIGNPAAFRHTLDRAGCEVVLWRTFADHQPYTAGDREQLQEAVAASDAEMVLCTHKDLVKLPNEPWAGRELWAVVVEMAFLAGEAQLQPLLEAALENHAG